jgi:hypothetical protein
MLPPDLPTPADTSFTIQTSLSGDIITPISPQFAAIVVIRRQQSTLFHPFAPTA